MSYKKSRVPFDELILRYKNKSPDDALFQAACNGHTEIVKVYLNSKKNANLNKLHAFGYGRNTAKLTPLMIASYKGYTTIAEILIKKGAKINKKDSNGHPALYYSIDGGRPTLTRLLLKYNAKTNINIDDIPLYHWYAENNFVDPESYDIILEKAKDLSYISNVGKTFIDVLFSDPMMEYLTCSYMLQKMLIKKNPLLIKSLKNNNYIHPKIEKNYNDIVTAADLNLL
jgi:ankyrin repeat protein